MTKKIAIDTRMAFHTGIGRYIRGLILGLGTENKKFEYTLIADPKLVPIYSLSEQLVVPLAARSCQALHVPHYNIPVVWPKKLIVTIHDLIHLEFAKDFSPLAVSYAKTMLSVATTKADAIIAVSHKTKIDLVEQLGVPAKKITVIHHGIDPFFAQTDSLPKTHQDRYFLYVGLIKTHKNTGLLLEAFRYLKKKTGDTHLKLKIIGKWDLKQKTVRQWLDSIANNPDIILESDVDDQKLKELYRGAIALVFPSLYEGFGFPLLEAMGCGTPVLAARSSSIPEVLGEETGLYFDPSSRTELEHCMEKMLSNETLRTGLIQKGFERSKNFDWTKTAEATENIYESVFE